MNHRFRTVLQNFSYTLASNFITFLITFIVTLIVPKIVGPDEYGLFQLFVFYTTYTGIFHFGWSDGIYLRFGGAKYEELDKQLFFSQFYMQLVMQFIIAITAFFVAGATAGSPERIFIFQMLAIYMLLINARGFFMLIMQATNRIKEYAKVTLLFRVPYFALILVLLLLRLISFRTMIIADLIGAAISTGYAMFCCRDIVIGKFSDFQFNFREVAENIRVGSKLLFANFASIMILGVIRFGIDMNWDVATFGKTSLALTASNMMMIFISAISIVIFPILKRTDTKRYPAIYSVIRDLLMFGSLGLLIVYYPAKTVLALWLPKYAESLRYMALLFPVFIFDGKTSLLTNTYFKALREEKKMFHINLLTCVLSILSTVILAFWLRNLDMAILSIVVLLAFRSVVAEIMLSKVIHISVYRDISMEIALTVVFILSGWFIQSWLTVAIYGTCYCLYLLLKRRDLQESMKKIKIMMR